MGRPGVGAGRADRPSPGDQCFRGWAAALPSPSHFPTLTGRPIKYYIISARSGPCHWHEPHEIRALYSPARRFRWLARGFLTGRTMGRPMCCFVIKRWTTCFFFYIATSDENKGPLGVHMKTSTFLIFPSGVVPVITTDHRK